MLGSLLRRLLWAVPTLFGVSLVCFFLTTLLPEAEATRYAEREVDPARRSALEDLRRNRFLDLPTFFNAQPDDVQTKTPRLVQSIATQDANAGYSARRLQELGGAALPYFLPNFSRLDLESRTRVALALAPVAERMGLGDPAQLREPKYAVRFWTTFWEDRATDFTRPATKRELDRLARKVTTLREQDLFAIDTYALPELMERMDVEKDADVIVRLARFASHVTGKPAPIGDHFELEQANSIRETWQAFWLVHASDYVAFDGAGRVAASLSETRYSKWTYGAGTGRLGLALRDGEPLEAKLFARAPVTLAMTLLAIALSLCLAIPLGVITAWRRGERVDLIVALVLLALYSVPSFGFAQLFASFVPKGTRLGLAAPVLVLSAAAIATLARQQRAALLEVMTLDYVRTARAKGMSRLRVVVVHALRNAIIPVVQIAGLEFPAALGTAFVVEEALDIHGMGWETLRALESSDTAWLVLVVLVSAVITTLLIVASDVATQLLDPRARSRDFEARG